MDSQEARDTLSRIMTEKKKYRVRFSVQGYIGESSHPYISFTTEPIKDIRNARVILKTLIVGGASWGSLECDEDGVWKELLEERLPETHQPKHW